MSEQPDYARQPEPIKTDGRDIADIVISELAARKMYGVAKYGTALQAFNGRDALQDAIDEATDLLLYLTQLREERDASRRRRGSGQDDGDSVVDATDVPNTAATGGRSGALSSDPFSIVVFDRHPAESDRLYGAILPQSDQS